MQLARKVSTPPAPVMQRLVLIVAVLSAFVAFLDGTVITVALPAITRELGEIGRAHV